MRGPGRPRSDAFRTAPRSRSSTAPSPRARCGRRSPPANPSVPLHGGSGRPAAGPQDLAGAPAQARYALTSARITAPDAALLSDATSFTSLDALLTGVPPEVRTVYCRAVLGPLTDAMSPSAAPFLETPRTFLACDGSWARTAEALHLHVDTVHYRIRRIEHFTGRDLSGLTDRLDLWAALLCHEEPAGDRALPALVEHARRLRTGGDPDDDRGRGCSER
ncbi:PucR family transcriptional regulator [Streptomyces sp. NPDC059832]|uniref:PucR family transcriptional regulator n=1 Tax=unclassified Streptomyces TaxID=2593676 RepID=UPI003665440F